MKVAITMEMSNQMNRRLHQEIRGSMTQFIPLTPEIIETVSGGEVSYEQLAERLKEFDLSIDYVVHDSGRSYQNTFYADYEHGVYCELYLNKSYLAACTPTLEHLAQILHDGNIYLEKKRWSAYYDIDVPLAMQAFDFQKRMLDIDPAQVFEVWYRIYKRLDYSNGVWWEETIRYVFSHAPTDFRRPMVEPNGLIRLYRGMGALSQSPETAISWSTHPGNALWFANHTGRGNHMVVAEAAPEDIVAYFLGYEHENEALVWPGKVRYIRYEDMFPAEQETFVKLVVPALKDYRTFGRQAEKFGYTEESWLHVHGIKHVLRVLFLSLVYFYNSGDRLTDADRDILIYFSLLHDVARTNEAKDESHGAASVAAIRSKNLRVSDLKLDKKDYRIARLLIEFHCRDDAEGLSAIERQANFSKRDKDRAKHLYCICKDMDGLDRVRFNGLDYRYLRTPFARKLPLIAGAFLQENLLEALKEL